MSLFLYKLVPSRPTFAHDMSEAEAAVMERHFVYWRRHLDAGTALVYGPVADPAGTWGLAIVRAESEEAARALTEGDPAVAGGVATSQLHELPNAVAAFEREAA